MTMLSPPERLEQYANLVRRYATTLDLSSPEAIKVFDEQIRKTEVYDSHLETGIRVLDIGSGVGLPGIPIAVRRPDVHVTLAELRKRRAAFLEIAVSKLGLANVTVYNGDVAKLRAEPFDAVTAQAVGSLGHTYSMSKHLLKTSWKLLSKKGQRLEAELDTLRALAPVRGVILETIDSDSTLICVQGGGA